MVTGGPGEYKVQAMLNALLDPASLRRPARQLDRHGPADRSLCQQVHRPRRPYRCARPIPGSPSVGPNQFRIQRTRGGSELHRYHGHRNTRPPGHGRRHLLPGHRGLGFSFDFYGQNYTSLNIGTNGLITLSGAEGFFQNSDLSSFPTFSTIAPYWDDLDTPLHGGAVYYQVRGPN